MEDGSSSNSSSKAENREEYAYPSHISTPSLSVKLSDRGKYNLWKTQMIYFLTGHGMLGFIDGKFASPKGNEKEKMEVMEAWKRSDALVVSWILGTLSEEVSMYVVNGLTTSMNPNVVFTAKDVWNQLERIYGPKILQQATGSISDSSFIVEIKEYYPYPSHISTPSLIASPSITYALFTLGVFNVEDPTQSCVTVGALHVNAALTWGVNPLTLR